MSQLLAPLPSVEAYVAHFSQQTLPVLRRTVHELDALGVDPDRAATSLVGLWDGLQLQSLLDPRVDVVGCLRDYLDGILLPDPEPA